MNENKAVTQTGGEDDGDTVELLRDYAIIWVRQGENEGTTKMKRALMPEPCYDRRAFIDPIARRLAGRNGLSSPFWAYICIDHAPRELGPQYWLEEIHKGEMTYG